MDQLNQCNLMVAKNDTSKPTVGGSSNFTKPRQYFPFKQRNLSVLTLRVGEEGVHMTVDGKHTTSFAIREVSSYVLTRVVTQVVMSCLMSCMFFIRG